MPGQPSHSLHRWKSSWDLHSSGKKGFHKVYTRRNHATPSHSAVGFLLRQVDKTPNGTYQQELRMSEPWICPELLAVRLFTFVLVDYLLIDLSVHIYYLEDLTSELMWVK